jgi:hypothetical protein
MKAPILRDNITRKTPIYARLQKKDGSQDYSILKTSR